MRVKARTRPPGPRTPRKWHSSSHGFMSRPRRALKSCLRPTSILRNGGSLSSDLRWPSLRSNQNPLDLIEADLVVASVVEAGGAGAFVVGHLLRDFQLAAVPKVLGNAGSAEGMAADRGRDAGGERAAADHAPHVHRLHRLIGEFPCAAGQAGEEP